MAQGRQCNATRAVKLVNPRATRAEDLSFPKSHVVNAIDIKLEAIKI